MGSIDEESPAREIKARVTVRISLATICGRSAGRPDCVGCEDEIVALAKQFNIERLFIIADNATPGQRRAAKLKQTKIDGAIDRLFSG
jgi:hypothetical protein